ncbi:MAG: hypothetical protein WA131_00430 [Desulfitobacteriaceae bacterium]
MEILVRSNTIPLFKKNPQKYMEQVSQIIASKMKLMIVDGSKHFKALGKEILFEKADSFADFMEKER